MDEGFVAAGNDLVGRLAAGLDAFAEMIMAESLRQCPVETGTLKGSARVGEVERRAYAYGGGFSIRGAGGRFVGATSGGAQSGDVEIVIGYGYGDEVNPKTHRLASEYAAPVHEIIEAYHEPPTKAKFLEDPVYEHSSAMEPVLAAYMKAPVAPSYALNAFIEGDSQLMGEGAGAAKTADLDAGDHPKGTPHE